MEMEKRERKEEYKKRRKYCIDSCICIRCSTALEIGYTHIRCAACRLKEGLYAKTRSESSKLLGMCSNCCIRKASEGFLRCDKCIKNDRMRRRDAKVLVFNNYGNSCACCGESNAAFLQIDHINNDGNVHRRAIGAAGSTTYRWLVKMNLPIGFQTLCANCNYAKRMVGICPHQLN